MMNTRLSRYAIAPWLLVAALTGCTVLEPQPDPTQYYILTPISESAPGENPQRFATSHSDLAIGVGPITFPGYLKRPEVVTRATGNQLQVSDVKRWGERLDKNFESVLAQNLGQLLTTQKVITYPWYGKSRIDYQVEVRVERFEATENGKARLIAVWTIKSGADGAELGTGEFRNETAAAASSESDATAALSQSLAELSREIAARIAEINAHSPKTPSAATEIPPSVSHVAQSSSDAKP